MHYTSVEKFELEGPYHREKLRFPNFGYFRVFKKHPQKSQIWESETNPNQGIPNQVPKLSHSPKFGIFVGILQLP